MGKQQKKLIIWDWRLKSLLYIELILLGIIIATAIYGCVNSG